MRKINLGFLQTDLRRILAQDQGAGGNLTEQEILSAMRRGLFELFANYYTTRREETVVFCTHCKGEGTTTRSELTDYHRRDYMTIINPCKVCGETGRLRQTVFTIHEPFIPHK